MFDFSGFNADELAFIIKKQKETTSIMHDKAKLMEAANAIVARIKNIPVKSRDKAIEEDVVNLTLLAIAMSASLGIEQEVAASKVQEISQVLSVVYLLGLQKGMQIDEIPDCFKDAFKGRE